MTDEEWNVINTMLKEIERLRKYEKLVRFIDADYWELSHDKVRSIYADYKKRCRKLIEEDHKDDGTST